MNSNSRKHSRRARHRAQSGKSRRTGRKRHRSASIKASSSFASLSVTPSREPVSLKVERLEGPSECGGFVWGLLGVCVLVLLGGGHYACALGFALILPGLALLLRPPTCGLGKWMDVGIIGVLGALLFAFVPLFYWQEPTWRTTAVEVFGVDLSVLLSVQPWISFEAFLSAIAGFSWLYAAASWKVNYVGRRKIYFVAVCLIAVFAAVVALGTFYGWRYPAAEDAPVFSFFPNRNQTSNFIALGGVFAFGYAMEGIRAKKLRHFLGLFASVFCLLALVQGVSRAGLLLYLGGIVLWFIFSLRRRGSLLLLKFGVPAVLLIFSFLITSHESAVERVTESLWGISNGGEDYRILIYKDTWEMIEDAPLTGVGVGNFSAVFPQYRDLSRNAQYAVHPESDLFWLGAEGGLVAVLFFCVLIVSYFWRCRESRLGRSGAYRMIALTCVILFLVHGLFDVSGHRPGTAYFAILFAALALPRRADVSPILTPKAWRVLGGGLLAVGVLWFAGGLFGLGTHSSVLIANHERSVVERATLAEFDLAEQAVDGLVAWQPLKWQRYYQRAQVTLSQGGDHSLAEQDFRRARFAEPNLGLVAYEEGLAWLPYDVNRTVSAWREALIRNVDSKSRLYNAMLREANRDVALMEGMIDISRVDPSHRAGLLLYLRGELLSREVEAELRDDPSLGKFTVEDRTAIVRHWIRDGELGRVESYLDEYGDSVNRPWRLLAMLYQRQSRALEAVELMRGGIAVPELPEVMVDLERIDQLKRRFFMVSSDLATGVALLSYYLENSELHEAIRVVDELLQQTNAPTYLYYLRGEILYQMKDFSESWYAYESYLEELELE